LEHPLSGIKPQLAHGLGLAMLLPAVVEHIYPAVPEILSSIYQPIVPGLKGIAAEAQQCAEGLEDWLFSVGIESKLRDEGYTREDIDKLTNLTLTTPSLDTLLSVAPIAATEQTIRSIYEQSF
jgi:alcohol dehydrogenase class IV